jgi:hypothetical protein
MLYVTEVDSAEHGFGSVWTYRSLSVREAIKLLD